MTGLVSAVGEKRALTFQELLFTLLRKMLDDDDARVRTQAARFLALLDDPRCAAEVARVLKK